MGVSESLGGSQPNSPNRRLKCGDSEAKKKQKENMERQQEDREREKGAASTRREKFAARSRETWSQHEEGETDTVKRLKHRKAHREEVSPETKTLHRGNEAEKDGSEEKEHEEDNNFDEEDEIPKMKPRTKIKRSDTVEEKIPDDIAKKEKLALNTALESMCNPLHSFQFNDFAIKSQDGMSYGYGRLEVHRSPEATRREPQDEARPEPERSRRRQHKLKSKMAAAAHTDNDSEFSERRDSVSRGGEKNRKKPKRLELTDFDIHGPRRESDVSRRFRSTEKKRRDLELTEFDVRRARSLTASPHRGEAGTLDKREKDYENTQSMTNVQGTDEEGTSKSDEYSPWDFRTFSLPMSFSDPETSSRAEEANLDLIRSLTAAPLRMTGTEKRVDLNYLSSLQWFTSDTTGQLNHCVRTVLSESENERATDEEKAAGKAAGKAEEDKEEKKAEKEENEEDEKDDAGTSTENKPEKKPQKPVMYYLNGVEIAGTPYKHPDGMRTTNNFIEDFFHPLKKKTVKTRDRRALETIKKQSLFG